MINDLLKIEYQMNLLNIQLSDDWHSSLKVNAKGAKLFFLIRVNKDGICSIEDNKEEHFKNRCYFLNNSNNGLTFKKSTSANLKKDLSKIKAGLDCTINLAQKVCDGSKELEALEHLSECLKKISPLQLWEFIAYTEARDFLNENCYISLEIENDLDFYAPVQSEVLQRAISNRLFEIEKNEPKTSDNLDVFGSPDPTDVKLDHKIGEYCIKPYSKNEDNDCYMKYGVNGHDAFPMSNESRARLVRLMNLAFSEEKNEISVHTKLMLNKIQFICISTLTPNEKNWTSFSDSFSINEWKEECTRIINNIKTNKYSEILPGEIVVFRKPSNGPWNIEYNKSFTSDELQQAFEKWNQGLTALQECKLSFTKHAKYNLHFKIPTLFLLTKILSTKFVNEGKKYGSYSNYYWSLKDSLELFAGSEQAVNKAMKIMAKFIMPVFANCGKLDNDVLVPKEMNEVMSIAGLLLIDKDNTVEDLLDEPFFCMGRMFKEADRIHKQFLQRSGASPPQFIGQRHMILAQSNPELALSAFYKKFQKYLNWAENHNWKTEINTNFCSIRTYKEMVQKVGQNIPKCATPKQINQLAIGFVYSKPKVENKETAEETVSTNVEATIE